MADFEVMPIGTKAAMTEAAALAREMEAIHIRRQMRAAEAGRSAGSHAAKANRHCEMAEKLERLLN